IRDHVRPRRRRPLAFAERCDILPASVRKAADAVKEGNLWRSQSRLRISLSRSARLESRRQILFDWASRQLIFQRTSFTDDHDTRDGVKQNALFFRHRV